jgi:hypothetical protein
VVGNSKERGGGGKSGGGGRGEEVREERGKRGGKKFKEVEIFFIMYVCKLEIFFMKSRSCRHLHNVCLQDKNIFS